MVGRGQSGSHPVYRLTIQYLPTAKTTASFHFGYEGTDVEPDLQLAVQWQFRENTSSELSVYQNSNFSTYDVGQNLVTRGVLASVQQRLFARMNLTLSAGAEQSSGYQNVDGVAQSAQDQRGPLLLRRGDPVSTKSTLTWPSRATTAAIPARQARSSRKKVLQSRASLSLRLTF